MPFKIATLQPTNKNYPVIEKVMDTALKEIIKEVIKPDWHLFKDLKGMEIATDHRFKNFLRMRKYPVTKFKYAISPMKEEDFIKKNVVVDVALETKSNSIVGFSVWAFNMDLQEHNILVFIYVFLNHRRQKIAKQLLGHRKTKVIAVDNASQILRRLLKTYFNDRVVFGLKDAFEWKPESENEKEKLSKLLERPIELLTSTFDNFIEVKTD